MASSTALSSLKSSSRLEVVLLPVLALVLVTFDLGGSVGAGRLTAGFDKLAAAAGAAATAEEDTAGAATEGATVAVVTAREFTDEVTESRCGGGCGGLRLVEGCLLGSGGGACVGY